MSKHGRRHLPLSRPDFSLAGGRLRHLERIKSARSPEIGETRLYDPRSDRLQTPRDIEQMLLQFATELPLRRDCPAGATLALNAVDPGDSSQVSGSGWNDMFRRRELNQFPHIK
jgi:hypothetical protein